MNDIQLVDKYDNELRIFFNNGTCLVLVDDNTGDLTLEVQVQWAVDSFPRLFVADLVKLASNGIFSQDPIVAIIDLFPVKKLFVNGSLIAV